MTPLPLLSLLWKGRRQGAEPANGVAAIGSLRTHAPSGSERFPLTRRARGLLNSMRDLANLVACMLS